MAVRMVPPITPNSRAGSQQWVGMLRLRERIALAFLSLRSA